MNRWGECWCHGDARCANVEPGPLAGSTDIDRVRGLGGVGCGMSDDDGVLTAFDWNLRDDTRGE